jgi:hypothetical protein
MDLMGDDNSTINQKQQTIKWDRKKKKFVKVGPGTTPSGTRAAKQIRLESGQMVSVKKAEKGKL